MKNPRIVPLAWYRSYQEMELEILGPDPWAYGLDDANRRNLETAIGYSHESGLISRRLAIEELFTDLSPGRGRGQRKRI
jgi:4,5-dihydroxyphthalate decarboxylase